MDNMLSSVRNQARGVARRIRSVPDTTHQKTAAPAPVAAAGRRPNAMGIDVSPVHGHHCDCSRCLADSGHDAA